MSKIMVSSTDVSLFNVASSHLGDATQWWRIASLNGMTDPDLTWIPYPIEIDLPLASPSLSGGAPPTDGT